MFPVKLLCLNVLDDAALSMELKTNGKLKPLDSDANSVPLVKLRCTLFGLGWGGGIGGGGGSVPITKLTYPTPSQSLNIGFLES